MFDLSSSPWFTEIVSSLVVSVFMLSAGFLIGRQRERRNARGKNLEDYDFYPFVTDRDNFPEFSLRDFRLGVHYFLKNADPVAAGQLIMLGEQNGVREQLGREELMEYERLFTKYKGHQLVNENDQFLENYRRLVRLIGCTFPNMGIEMLLHDLVNPAKSITCIEGGEVTGRSVGMGTTSLVVDLKRRKQLNQDKLNYELNIGARRFKCTTVPIYREPYGLVAAVCINIDLNYINDSVTKSVEEIQAFFSNYCTTAMQLDENILSRAEYELALKGKRHWKEVLG